MARFLNYLIIIALFVLVGFSCESNQKEQYLSDYNSIKPVLELALSEFNAGKLPNERGFLQRGSVDISQEENKIKILFEERNSESFQLFYLQVKEDRPTIDASFIEDAGVLFLRRGLVVHSNDNGENYLFTLEDFEARGNSHLAKLDFMTEYAGYGLGFLDNIDPSLKVSCNCTCESALVLDPEPCDSGGPGSVSCSQGDCSVSCNGGYYSCCNC
jgi:hypothetical protein